MDSNPSNRNVAGVNPGFPMAVIIPTYRRTADLRRCLDAVAKQRRRADQVIVVHRDSDEETKCFLAERSETMQVEVVVVSAGGQVAALNAGLARVRGGIVSFTDDDAAPRPDWLARIEAYFVSNKNLGGVGGRDHIAGISSHGKGRVGVLEWFGRPIGNHHCGTGSARNVDILKGSNMSYRMSALENLRFDERLRGQGAQRSNDLAFSLAVRKRGWQIVYDPALVVDHFPGERIDGIERSELSLRVVHESAYNETLAVLGYIAVPFAPLFLLWSMLVGTRDLPGIVQCFRNVSKHPAIWHVFKETARARFDAVTLLRASRNGVKQS